MLDNDVPNIGGLSGIVSFEDVLSEAFDGRYVFHGSNVLLQPGLDRLQPNSLWLGERVVFTGSLDVALRFALVRKWGKDQMQGSDFYTFVTPQYKLIVHTKLMGLNWYRDTASTYIYAVSSNAVEPGKYAHSGGDLPIAARAEITPVGLFNSGVDIGIMNGSVRNLFCVPNEYQAVKNYVLPNLMSLHKNNAR